MFDVAWWSPLRRHFLQPAKHSSVIQLGSLSSRVMPPCWEWHTLLEHTLPDGSREARNTNMTVWITAYRSLYVVILVIPYGSSYYVVELSKHFLKRRAVRSHHLLYKLTFPQWRMSCGLKGPSHSQTAKSLHSWPSSICWKHLIFNLFFFLMCWMPYLRSCSFEGGCSSLVLSRRA